MTTVYQIGNPKHEEILEASNLMEACYKIGCHFLKRRETAFRNVISGNVTLYDSVPGRKPEGAVQTVVNFCRLERYGRSVINDLKGPGCRNCAFTLDGRKVTGTLTYDGKFIERE